MENDLSKRRCVICAAGPVTDMECLRKLLHEEDDVIAADGGLRLAEALGRKPKLIVADFDSMPRMMAEQNGAPVASLPVKKDDTDTLAAVKIALARGYRNILLMGATGGRLDHTMANIAVLLYIVNHGAKAVLADEKNRLEMVLPGHYVVDPADNTQFSLLPYGGCVSGLNVKHAEYPLENATLFSDIPLGVSNEFQGCPVEISFKQGILMIFLSKD